MTSERERERERERESNTVAVALLLLFQKFYLKKIENAHKKGQKNLIIILFFIHFQKYFYNTGMDYRVERCCYLAYKEKLYKRSSFSLKVFNIILYY